MSKYKTKKELTARIRHLDELRRGLYKAASAFTEEINALKKEFDTKYVTKHDYTVDFLNDEGKPSPIVAKGLTAVSSNAEEAIRLHTSHEWSDTIYYGEVGFAKVKRVDKSRVMYYKIEFGEDHEYGEIWITRITKADLNELVKEILKIRKQIAANGL